MKLIILILVSNYRCNSLAETTIGAIQDPRTNALECIFNAATLLCPIMMIGTEKRGNLATDAPAQTVVKREVARAGLLVVSSGKSLMLSDRLATLMEN